MNFKLSLRAALALTLVAVLCASDVSQDFELKKAGFCNLNKCHLPSCRCAEQSLPKSEFRGLENQIPQMVMVTFDDAVNAINYEQYQYLFEGLVNPDHCPARGTFFVTHEYTDYVKVNKLYTQGHEIALHSVTHGTGTDYWRTADVELLMREFGDQIEMLERFAKVNRTHIRGMRLPFLEASGDNSFVAAKRLGLLYDSSLPTQNAGMWPYTLDFRSAQVCQIGRCPESAIPGLWVLPMNTWEDLQGYKCAMIDGCIVPPADDVDALFDWMLDNFNQHYESNRAPFPMFMHAAWFARGRNYLPALRKFLLHLSTLPDVYIVPTSRALQYVRNPVLGQPFKGCVRKPQARCKPRSCTLAKMSTQETRYMNACDRCPEVYPWLNNPLGTM